MKADQILNKSAQHIADRASSRDTESERSMKRCVEAFNELEGTQLTETQGWRFMVTLKYARATAGKFNMDDYEDMAAYAALAAECESSGGGCDEVTDYAELLKGQPNLGCRTLASEE